MGNWFKLLVGAASVAVIAVSVTWMIDRNAVRKAAIAEKATIARQMAIEADLEMKNMKRKCTNPVLAWRNGYKDVAEKAFGPSAAAAAVEQCERLFPELLAP